MAESVDETIREMLVSMSTTIEALLALPDGALQAPSSHVCAQGHDIWALLTNDIDHERIHAANVLDARVESRNAASPLARLAGEWLQARAAFVASLVGLDDATFQGASAPGQWTYERIARHLNALEQDSLAAIHADLGARPI